MTIPSYTVDTIVSWTDPDFGVLTGRVVEIVPPLAIPASSVENRDITRDHESYVVKVPSAAGTPEAPDRAADKVAAAQRLFWPFTTDLRRVDSLPIFGFGQRVEWTTSGPLPHRLTGRIVEVVPAGTVPRSHMGVRADPALGIRRDHESYVVKAESQAGKPRHWPPVASLGLVPEPIQSTAADAALLRAAEATAGIDRAAGPDLTRTVDYVTSSPEQAKRARNPTNGTLALAEIFRAAVRGEAIPEYTAPELATSHQHGEDKLQTQTERFDLADREPWLFIPGRTRPAADPGDVETPVVIDDGVTAAAAAPLADSTDRPMPIVSDPPYLPGGSPPYQDGDDFRLPATIDYLQPYQQGFDIGRVSVAITDGIARASQRRVQSGFAPATAPPGTRIPKDRLDRLAASLGIVGSPRDASLDFLEHVARSLYAVGGTAQYGRDGIMLGLDVVRVLNGIKADPAQIAAAVRHVLDPYVQAHNAMGAALRGPLRRLVVNRITAGTNPETPHGAPAPGDHGADTLADYCGTGRQLAAAALWSEVQRWDAAVAQAVAQELTANRDLVTGTLAHGVATNHPSPVALNYIAGAVSSTLRRQDVNLPRRWLVGRVLAALVQEYGRTATPSDPDKITSAIDAAWVGRYASTDPDKRKGSVGSIGWLERIKALKPGDPCEVRPPASPTWIPGVVKVNGMGFIWTVTVKVVDAARLTPGLDIDATTEWHPYIEQVRCPGQTDAWPLFGRAPKEPT